MTVGQIRHALERGALIRTLKEDYTAEMTSVRALIGALDLQGVSLALKDLCFHLEVLADGGYVRIWRARDMPGFRADRLSESWAKPATILFAKLLPKGLQLLDGLIPEDPSIKF